MAIKIVTDSTCDLPENVIKDLRITVVPLFINIGERGYLDGVEITRKDFYTNLPDYADYPSTSTPGMDSFTRIYEELALQGATQILSIHISKSLSATIDVANRATKMFTEIPVVARDSRQLSTGTGFQVETAARMAQEGKSLDEITHALDDLAECTLVAAGLDSLDYLRRSGRLSAIMTGLGSILQLKPILTMVNGNPGSERVRTARKVEDRLVEMVEGHQPIERFALLHANAPTKAEALRSRISHLIEGQEVYSMNITPVIGTHIGPGAAGFALISETSIGKA
jgi:DegV family protein with EDD domain